MVVVSWMFTQIIHSQQSTMSFNLDDPLAGILSDGSDDSFFDDDILGKKKPAKKKTTPVAEKKNALFDLGEDDKKFKSNALEDKNDAKIRFGASDVIDKPEKLELTKSPGSFKRTVSKESIKVSESKSSLGLDFPKSPAKIKNSSNPDKLNILDDLLEPKKDTKPKLEKGKSSQSILDDILGGTSVKPPITTQGTRPTTAAVKNQESELNFVLGRSESKQNLVPPKSAQPKLNPKLDTTDEKSAKKKTSSQEWLGIFGDQDENNGEREDTGMPAWLVGDTKKKKKEDTKKESAKPKEISKEPDEEEAKPKLQKQTEPHLTLIKEPPIKMPDITFQSNNEDITAEGAALYMHQQESQLMLALQLKAQEEKLAEMQIRQKEVERVKREATQAQHAQLDAMLRRQAEQRQQMQAIIATHQARITQRIRELLGPHPETDETTQEVNDEGRYETIISETKEKPYNREKKQLLQLVQSLQENHDKEIDLMETSYRRQLAFLEVSLHQYEDRVKEESDKLVKFYSEKIGWLEEHHQLYKKMSEDNLAALQERHKTENETLRRQHSENISILQEHHAALMENIKNAVKQEQILIKDSAGFSSDLHELVVDVKESKSQCRLLVEKVESLTENTQRDAEKNLQVRETLVNDMMQQLKKERENFDIEKTESRDIVKMLEARLKQLTSIVEEETAALRQKKMEFEFEKATFTKQTEFAKNILKKQDEEMKAIREELQKEHEDKIAKLDEERAKAVKDSAAIAKEKASVQNLKQELEKTKAELHAQLEEVSEERTKLNIEKQQMHLEEQRILAKSRDLDLLAKTAIEKQTQADRKYSEAEFIQRKYEDRIRRLQEHVVSLNNREKAIAREKVALSRERLSLHNERKQIESRQCCLCRSTQNQNVQSYSFEQNYALPDSFLNTPVTRDYESSNMNSAMTAIEQEMAHLLGRNFGLKHSTGVRTEYTEGRFAEVGDISFTQPPPPPQPPLDSGAFKELMDPKFMMLRLDVQQVLSNIESRKDADDNDKDPDVEQAHAKE